MQANSWAGLTIMGAMGALGLRAIFGWVFEPLEVEGAHGHTEPETAPPATRSRRTGGS